MAPLSILRRKEIDDRRWNTLIENAVNSLPYAYTWYLDAVGENWDAVVWNDYEAVMPLPWLRKFGIKCLYQPYYCQQLGVFSAKQPGAEVLQQIVAAAAGYSYSNINLNPSVKPVVGLLGLTSRKNLLLDLKPGYEKIQKAYTQNHQRNIARAQKAGLQFSVEMDLKTFQRFYLETIDRTKENFKPQHEKIFKAFTKAVFANNKGRICLAKTGDGKIAAAVLLLVTGNRYISITNTSTTEGKKTGASHFLYDRVIKHLSGENSKGVLDFEGSSVPGIARFYQGFGAYEEVFYNLQSGIISRLKAVAG